MAKPNIQSVLVLSTGHVTEATRRVFDGEAVDTVEDDSPEDETDIGLPMFSPVTYGWLMWRDDDWENERHPEMVAIIALAKANGCEWIRFDCDEPQLEDLPFFDWEDREGASACERNSGEGGLV